MATTTFAKLIVDTAPATLEALCKQQIAGKDTGLEKHNYIEAIQKRGDLLFPMIASPQGRFTKAMTEDDTGRLLYAAAKAATGSEVNPASAIEEDPQIPDTPAMAQIRVLALDYARSHPYKSKEQCFTAVYTAPANRQLREKAVAEQMAAARARSVGKSVPVFPILPNDSEKALEPLIEKYQAAHPDKSYQQAYVATLESNPALGRRVLEASRYRATAAG
jgi:hypothetical protein